MTSHVHSDPYPGPILPHVSRFLNVMTMDLRTREYFRLEEEEAQRTSGGDFSEFINLYEREMISAKIDDRFGKAMRVTRKNGRSASHLFRHGA